ncbi:MAG: YdcF family protein [Gammaproteobacteria bacterium]|nr:YdcF family protein [Gammaproteobacteria bacterium]
MGFALKKVISGLLLPLPISLILLLLALLLLCCRKKTVGLLSLLLGLLVLLVSSISPVAFSLLHKLETNYQPLQQFPSDVKQIVVLGGGIGGNPNYPPNTRLSSASLSRLVEAIRIYKHYQAQQKPMTLILSGGRVFGSPSDANKMRNTAVVLGIKSKQFILANGSQDTASEAHYIQKIVRDKPFILVTSAYHMRRAMLLFKRLGMQPIAAPTQYLIRSNQYRISRYLPSAYNLVLSDIAIHEYLGLVWAHMHG